MKIEHEFDKEIEDFKESTTGFVKKTVIDDGFIPPSIFILVYIKKVKQFDAQVFPIPPQLMGSGSGKDFLADVMLPNVISLLNAAGAYVLCVSLVSEAWMWLVENASEELGRPPSDRLTDAETSILKEKGKKREVVMLTFETEHTNTPVFLVKTGTHPRKDGSVTKNIKLEPWKMPDKAMGYGGRFTNLFKKQPNYN